jgi:hypothetical protein
MDQIANQKTNEIMQEVFDPLSIEDLKEKKTLNGIKADTYSILKLDSR